MHDMRKNEFIFTQKFSCSTNKLWRALTDPAEMVQWYFTQIPDFKAELGFTTQFNVEAPSRDFLHIWKVTDVEKGKKIVYSWEFEGVPGKGLTAFTIEGDDSKSELTLLNTGLNSFPDKYPEFTEESCIGGWTYFIHEQLVKYLEK